MDMATSISIRVKPRRLLATEGDHDGDEDHDDDDDDDGFLPQRHEGTKDGDEDHDDNDLATEVTEATEDDEDGVSLGRREGQKSAREATKAEAIPLPASSLPESL